MFGDDSGLLLSQMNSEQMVVALSGDTQVDSLGLHLLISEINSMCMTKMEKKLRVLL